MSVIIKSNNVALNSIGTLKMLETTPQAEFDKYKARVIADGGVIRDEARTLRAFESLFNAKMYGNINSFISGSFGIKLTDDNHIQKAYAIDGSDLIAQVYGSGSLPTLTTDDAIDFGSNTASNTNGALLTTAEQIKVSKANSHGIGLRLKRVSALSKIYVSAFTKHDDVVNTSQVTALLERSNQIQYQTQKDQLSLTAGINSSSSGLNHSLPETPFIIFLSNSTASVNYGYRDGMIGNPMSNDKTAALDTDTFYIDVGGYYRSNSMYFYDGAFYDYISISQATNEQALALSRFN